ncbi:MAG: hypothetical protein KAU50_11590 [Candidatus Marinimicrobia bacterium]|nr:hypothetical protein [Candidatus Neomarinimicrobiota bacterium]
MRQRYPATLIAILAIFITLASAQDTTDIIQQFEAGDRALVFRVDPNFTLASAQGSLISYTRHKSPNKPGA